MHSQQAVVHIVCHAVGSVYETTSFCHQGSEWIVKTALSHCHGSICVAWPFMASSTCIYPITSSILSKYCQCKMLFHELNQSINQSITGCESPMLEVIQVSMHYANNSKIIIEQFSYLKLSVHHLHGLPLGLLPSTSPLKTFFVVLS